MTFYAQTKRVLRRIPYLISIIMAQNISSVASSFACKRFMGVSGSEGKQNDVIVCASAGGVSSCKQHVIFFGGDVQDYKENMESHYINKNYVGWNLESTAQLLQSNFVNSAVFVVRPAEMLLKTFSIYRNFLSFDEDGRPEFTSDHGALVHLAKLYESALSLALESEKNSVCTASPESSSCSADIPVKLVAFSKGCVVLTQLMHELSSYKDDKEVKSFLNKVSAIYWLDGGHTGGVKAYITDDKILKDIVDLDKELFVLVTPYQIKDMNRRWIGREEAEFIKKLKGLKAKIQEFRFYMDEDLSIDNHFKVLTKVKG